MTEPAGERRIVSVLVTDVVDSTAIAERLGPERSKFLFDEIARLQEEQVLRFDGTVAQHTGDGLLALFGAPTAHEDDAERAVRAALAIHEAVASFAHEVGDAYGIELAVRAAVNTGPVVVPRRDEPVDVLYNALGDTVNVAARLQSHAPSGGIAIGPLTALQVASRFDLEELGTFELKGRAEAVVAHRVLREHEPESAAQSTLVGRERELAVIDGVFADLLEGRGAIVCLTGEAGIGKSRLVAEARKRYGDEVAFLEGQAVSYADSIPYWPVRELLRSWLDVGAAGSDALVRLELRAALARTLGNESPDAYPFLAKLMGLSTDAESEALLRDMSRDSVQRQAFDAMHDLVVALARERPVCLVLDDLHWADEATLELAEELLATSDEEAVVLLLLYRSERDHAAWRLGEQARQRYPHRHHELELRVLDGDESRTLAADRAGAALPESVAQQLAERSGGNPYFLEQALSDLLERGALRRSNGGYVLAGSESAVVPALVQEALQARLSRLDPQARELVGVAAVVGRTFAAPLLERLAPGVPLASVLSDLQRLDLVVEERRRPVAEYRFRHGLLREVAYESLLETRRRELHRAAGLALEELHVDAPEEIAGLLAYHFAEADEPEQAARYLVAAGDAARALYANQEALEHYRRAVPFLERVGDESGARDTLLRMGLTHHLAFEFEATNTTYREAFARRTEPEPALEPTERIETAVHQTAAVVPGYGITSNEFWIARHLFRGLVDVDARLNVVPDVAESFEISADGRRYAFRLRADARWSDGVPVTAHDFVFTWRAMRERETPTAFQLEDVVGAEALDDRLLGVELRAPRGHFLYLAAQVPLFPWPRHVAERNPDWYSRPGFPGNGPYILAEMDGEHVLLRASPSWNGGRGNVGEIRFGFIERRARTKARWESGELDVVLDSPRQSADTLAVSARSLGTWYAGFCCGRPPLDDDRVRRALAHAIDRERFVRSTEAAHEPAARGGFIPPALPAHSHRVGLEYDPERARALLAEAGFPGGKGIHELVLVSRQEADVGDAGDLADQWSSIGVRVAVELVRVAEMDQAIAERADVWLWGWQADYPDPEGMLSTFLASSRYVLRDKAVMELLEEGRTATDPDRRWSLYREADRLLVAELVAIVPLAYTTISQLYRPWVHNVDVSPLQEATIDRYVVHRDQRP